MSCYSESNSIDEEISKGVDLLLEGYFIESHSHFTKSIESAHTQDEKKIIDHYCHIANLCILRSNMEIGDYQAKLGRYELALEIYSELDMKASRDIPTTLQYQWKANSGTCLARLGRKEEAMSEYMQSLNLNPNSIKTLNNIAILLAEMGRYDESISAFEKSLHINPENYNALCGIAGCLRVLNHFKESEEFIAKSLLVSKKLHKLESLKAEKSGLNENVRIRLATESSFSSSSIPRARGEKNKYQSGKKDSDQVVPLLSHREGLRNSNLGKKATSSSSVRSPHSIESSSQYLLSPLSTSMIEHKRDQENHRNSYSMSIDLPKKDLLSKIMGKAGRKINTTEDQINHEKRFPSAPNSQFSGRPVLSASITFPRTSKLILQWPTPLYNTSTPSPGIRSSLSILSTSTPSIGSRRPLPFEAPSNVHFAHTPSFHQTSTCTPSKASLAPKSPHCSEKFYSNQVGDTKLSLPSPLPRLAQSSLRWKGNTTNGSCSISDGSKGFPNMNNQSNVTNSANLSLSLPDRETIKPSKISLEKIRQIALRQIMHQDTRYISRNISDASSVSSSSTCINHGTSTDDTESAESWSGKPLRYNRPSLRGDKNDALIMPFYPKNISRIKNTTYLPTSNRHRKNIEKDTIINASLDLSSPNIGNKKVFDQTPLVMTPLRTSRSQNSDVECSENWLLKK
jgi:tetratricopeptide (TPR) repeat protein